MNKLIHMRPLYISVVLVVGVFTSLILGARSHGPVLSPSAAFSDYRCSASGATATSRFRPHGAAANGATDDTSAIQNAIDAAASAGGGVVALGAGTFLINGHLVMKSNVKLVGVGPGTIIKAGPGFLESYGTGWRLPGHYDGGRVKRHYRQSDSRSERQGHRWRCKPATTPQRLPRRSA